MAEERTLLNMLTKYAKNTEKMQKFYTQNNFYYVVNFEIHLICFYQDLIPYDPINDSDWKAQVGNTVNSNQPDH